MQTTKWWGMVKQEKVESREICPKQVNKCNREQAGIHKSKNRQRSSNGPKKPYKQLETLEGLEC